MTCASRARWCFVRGCTHARTHARITNKHDDDDSGRLVGRSNIQIQMDVRAGLRYYPVCSLNFVVNVCVAFCVWGV